MSTIGKIFLVLNLILAGAFVGWAAQSLNKTEEFKKKTNADIVKLEESLAQKESELATANTSINSERSAKDAAQAERNNLQTDVARLKEQLAAEQRANEQLRGDVAKINETMTGLNERLAQIEQTKDAAQAAALKMQGERDAATRRADEADAAQRDAEEALSTAQLDIAALEKSNKMLKAQVDSRNSEIATMVAQYNIVRGEVAALKPINAQVVKVDYSLKPGLVALNVGANAGVQRGYTFEIYSGGTYKGQVKVETVHPDMCSALITLTKDGTQMSAGDSAATIL